MGASTAPKVAVAQFANGIVAAAVGAGVGLGVGVGTGAVGVGLGSGASGELAPFTPIAIATIATTTTAPDPSTSGRRRRPPDGSLIDSLLGLGEPARGGTRVVRDDHVGTGAADAAECFEDGGPLVERAGRGCMMEHRKLAADAVRGERYVGRVANPRDHIEVCERGLDHDDVRAFLDVKDRFAHCLSLVGGVHLVRAPIPGPGRAFSGVAEGAVEHSGELRAVREDRGLGESRQVERLADRGDLPVHHPARGDDVGAGRRLAHRGSRVQLEGRVVVDVTVVEQEAAVPMIRVLTQAAIGDEDAGVAEALAKRADRLLDDTLVHERSRPLRVLGRWKSGEEHAAETEADRLLHGRAQGIDALVTLTRHGSDRLRRFEAFADERRVNQLPGTQSRLAGEPAQRRGSAQTAGSLERESHVAVQRSRCGVRHSVSALTSPSTEATSATAWTVSPAARASAAVCSPMHTITAPTGSPPAPMAATRFRAVLPLVRVIASTPAANAARRRPGADAGMTLR